MVERLRTGIDALTAAATLSWLFLSAAFDSAVDMISGRELPHPDLKTVAEGPEPNVPRSWTIRLPKTVKRREERAA